ncbi:MAG: hypothetical protein SH809_01070 [Rhodothermales bacterium]|nr:hypothetical protein [Rhodothermales bacterium]
MVELQKSQLAAVLMESFESIQPFVETISLVAAAAGLWFMYVIHRREAHATIFIEYTKRYDEVMEEFSRHHDHSRVHLLVNNPPSPSPQLSRNVLRYLNLCAEEYALYQSKYISKKVWNIWEGEINRTLRSPLFIREWQELKEDFSADPEFHDYVKRVQRTTKPEASADTEPIQNSLGKN